MAFLHDEAFAYLERAWRQGRLAHAYLLTGPAGSGKRQLAGDIIRMVNGPSVPENPFRHPEVRLLEPESKSRRIRVEQVRDAETLLRRRAAEGVRKVVVLGDAERMMPQAANAFLKTLEEPPAHSLMLLVTAHPEMLLDTIVSRCLEVRLHACGRREIGASGQRLLAVLGGCAAAERYGVGQALGLCGVFHGVLAEAQAEIAGRHEEALDAEEDAYAKVTEGDWLKRREEYYKALTAAEYSLKRAELVEILIEWWADVLKHHTPGIELEHPGSAEATAALARRVDADGALIRLRALEELRDHLDRNVQETLALEAAFVRVFRWGD